MKNTINISARSQRRAIARRIKENKKNTVIVKANDAFTIIHPELVKLGWLYEERFGNVVELHDKLVITESPALRLVTDIYNVTIIPHQGGCEISRLEVWEEYQGHGHGGRFLNNLLGFLHRNGIKEIYVLPMPAGIGKSKQSLAYNLTALQRFYQKRGFINQNESMYWKFDENFSLVVNDYEVDESLLSNTRKLKKAVNFDTSPNQAFKLTNEKKNGIMDAARFCQAIPDDLAFATSGLKPMNEFSRIDYTLQTILLLLFSKTEFKKNGFYLTNSEIARKLDYNIVPIKQMIGLMKLIGMIKIEYEFNCTTNPSTQRRKITLENNSVLLLRACYKNTRMTYESHIQYWHMVKDVPLDFEFQF